MRAAVSVCVMFYVLVAAGCEQEPVNPGVEVLENPPSEVDLSHTRTVKIEINGQDLSEGVTLRQGVPVQVTGTIDLDQSTFESPDAHGLVHIRMLPVGTDEDAWGSWNYAMEWVGPATGELSFGGNADALPGAVRSPRLHGRQWYAGRDPDVQPARQIDGDGGATVGGSRRERQPTPGGSGHGLAGVWRRLVP